MMNIQTTWTLQVGREHQEEEKIHQKVEEEVKLVKHQGGQHDKLNHL
jgi:hypothetical protein